MMEKEKWKRKLGIERYGRCDRRKDKTLYGPLDDGVSETWRQVGETDEPKEGIVDILAEGDWKSNEPSLKERGEREGTK